MISIADKEGYHTMYARDFARKVLNGEISVSDIDNTIITNPLPDLLSIISEARSYKGYKPILYEVTTNEHPGRTLYLKPSELQNWIESTVHPGYEFTVNTVAFTDYKEGDND